MNNKNNTTPFSIIYDSFLSKITDDMFIEDTYIVIKRGKKNYYIGKKV